MYIRVYVCALVFGHNAHLYMCARVRVRVQVRACLRVLFLRSFARAGVREHVRACVCALYFRYLFAKKKNSFEAGAQYRDKASTAASIAVGAHRVYPKRWLCWQRASPPSSKKSLYLCFEIACARAYGKCMHNTDTSTFCECMHRVNERSHLQSRKTFDLLVSKLSHASRGSCQDLLLIL